MTNMTKTYRVFIDVRASNKEHALKGAKALAAQEGFDSFRIQEDPFTDEEEGIVLEIANIVGSDPWYITIFDKVAEELDLTDKELKKLLKKISKITNRP
jgi:DMSO/TMAO reductase YedYZ molybdopterin-dependent catalytic subunit